MPRRIFFVFVALVAIVAGVYQLRTQLLSSAVNATLASANLRLVQLDGLQLGWNKLSVETLVLGGTDIRYTLRGVQLRFSVLDVQPQSLKIEQALLVLSGAAPGPATSPAKLLLPEITAQLLAGPIESIAVEKLRIKGFSYPLMAQPVKLLVHWESDAAVLELIETNKTLTLELARLQGSSLSLTAEIVHGTQVFLRFQADLNKTPGGYEMHGGGELDVADVLPSLGPLPDWPQSLTQTSGEVFFTLSGLLDDDLGQFSQSHWQLQLLPQTKIGAQLVGEEFSGKLEFNMPTGTDVSIAPGGPQGFRLQIDAQQLGWKWAGEDPALEGEGSLSTLHCSHSGELHCETSMVLTVGANSLSVPGEPALLVNKPSVKAQLALLLKGDSLAVKVASGEWFRAESASQGEMQFSGPALVADSAASLQYQLSTGVLQLQADNIRALLPRVQWPELGLATAFELNTISLSRDEVGQFDGVFQLMAESLNLQAPDMWLPELSLESDIQLAGNTLSLIGDLRGGGKLPLLKIAAHYQIDSNSGSARVLGDQLNFDAKENRLSRHFAQWPFAWDILAGSMALEVDLNWHESVQGSWLHADIKHSVQGLAGVYKELGFIGLNSDVTAQFESPDHFFTQQAGTITLESLDVGVPLEALQARFNFDSKAGEFAFQDVEARVFGGRVWLEDAVLQAEQAHNKVFVGVDGVQLDQLLDLAGYDAVHATGRISGLLPLDVNKTGATMKRGMLAAKAPGGLFRYKAEISTDINPALVPVLAALEDYHYTVFQLEADYLDSGDLELAMVFRGSNPDVQQGRPIHLNLNVTDNIPALLRSLQSGRKIADTVADRLGAE